MSPIATVLPAERAPQDAILLTWPPAGGDWKRSLAQADRAFATWPSVISRFEIVLIVCLDHQHSRHVRQLLAAAGVVPERRRLHAVPSDDIWARDHGPITVYRNDQPVLLGFRFNGWGGKHACDLDDRSNTRLHALGAFGATPL